MKTYKLRVATGEGIRQTAKNYFAIVNEYNTTRGNILYNPLTLLLYFYHLSDPI